MSTPIEQIAQDEAVQPEHGARRFDVSDRPFQFPLIPLVCTLAETAALLRMSERQLEYMLARKQLALAELARIDRKRRFTGESIAREIKRLSTKRVG